MYRAKILLALGFFWATHVGVAFGLDQKTGNISNSKQLQSVKPPSPGTVPPKGGVVAVPATVSLECGGRTFNLSTGNGQGECQVTYAGDGRTQTGATCNDGKGNSSAASCGKGGCTGSKGAGSCTAGK